MLRFNKEQKHTLKIKLSPYLYLIKKYKLKYDSISIMPYLGKVVVQFHNYHNPKIKGLCSHEFDEREFKGLKIETYLTYQLKPLLED